MTVPITPVEITRSGPRALSIKWQDGHHSVFTIRGLRQGCGCASCIEELTGRRILEPQHVAQDINITALETIGRYGIQMVFSDRHNTGIYTFTALRENCPCPACRENGSGTRFDEREHEAV